MRQALRQIRDELGPDAVILSSKRTTGGVEVLTTMEYNEEAMAQLRSIRAQHDEAAPVASSSAIGANETLDKTFAQLLNQHLETSGRETVDQELMAAMRSEIEHLRILLKEQMAHLAEDSWRAKHPVEAAVLKRFLELDIERRVAAPIARAVAQSTTIADGWQTALGLLGQRIKVTDNNLFKQGVVALVGPSGAGKTTTIAKLAVRYALQHGRDELALVTTDRYRLAAYEQLKALGRIIDVPVRLVDEKSNLNRVLRSLRDKSLVLIDTAGLNLTDPDSCGQLAEFDSVTSVVKKLLVLPCTSQSTSLRAYCDQLQGRPVDGCVLTKTDELMRFGEVLSLVVEKALPVAYITNGQSIPDDMVPASAEQLLACLKVPATDTVAQSCTPVTRPSQPVTAVASIGH